MSLKNRLLKIAKSVMADYPFPVRDIRFHDVIREFKMGGWIYGEIFSGKTHRVVGKSVGKSGKIPPSFDIERDMERIKIQEVTYANTLKYKMGPETDMLVLEFVGDAGRTDTYVFTKIPYKELVAGSIPERVVKPRTTELRDNLISKLHEKGLHNLGTRMSKAGDQFGLHDGARRLGIGRNYVMANYLLVEDDSTPQRRIQNSRWNMWKQWLVKDVDDRLLDMLVEWVKQGPDMVDVRQRAFETRMNDYGKPLPPGRYSETAFATGLDRK